MAARTVVGINFGGSASSVAVISKEGLADCIANDDGERQISNALSFSGEEEYIGIPAKAQLVRNNANTILGFRNLVGKSYDSVSSVKPQFSSAPIVAGPDGQPAYSVTIEDKEQVLTAQEVANKYLAMLIGFASDFLGRKIDAAVLGVPSDFTREQCDALEKACKEAGGVQVLQFLHEAAAACVAYGLTAPSSSPEEEEQQQQPGSEQSAGQDSPVSHDRNVVVLDVGASTTTVTVLAARQGLYVPLATVRDTELGGESIDEELIQFFSKEFTKKNKGVTLDKSNHRANMKLRLSCEVVKRSLSASNSAACSIESLSEGIDFSGTINRTRFDLLAGKVYSRITGRIQEALKQAGLDPLQIQEVVLIGGTCKNPTLADRVGLLFPESTLVSSQIEPDQVIAKGCVLQALQLSKLLDDKDKEDASFATSKESVAADKVKVVSRPIGLVVPAPSSASSSSPSKTNPGEVDGKVFVTVIEANTPLPARRIVELPAPKGASAVNLNVWEGQEEIHVEAPPAKEAKPQTNGNASDEDDEEEEEEEEDARTKITLPKTQLAEIVVSVKSAAKVRVSIIVTKDGKVQIEAGQSGSDEGKQSLEL